jgi:AcrR family transcriptional regulator
VIDDRPAAAPAPANEERTKSRERMIAATIDCILEVGFYRATSNEIARRAGFTWGVIQRQFGSREALMLAVYEEEWQHLVTTLRHAEIVGESVSERIASLFAILWDYYSRPEFFAVLQITMNLRKDPKTSGAAREIVHRSSLEAEDIGPAIVRQVFPDRTVDAALMTYVYYSIRDFCIGVHIESATALEETLQRRLRHLDREKDLLLGGLTAMVKRESKPRAARRKSVPARRVR